MITAQNSTERKDLSQNIDYHIDETIYHIQAAKDSISEFSYHLKRFYLHSALLQQEMENSHV